MPQSARLSEGGGGQSLFGQCPNRPGIFLSGASLIHLEQYVLSWNVAFLESCPMMIDSPQREFRESF